MKLRMMKDESAKQVLEKLSDVVMGKLLAAQHSVELMEKELDRCLHQIPVATNIDDSVADAMAGNPEVSLDMVRSAAGETAAAKEKVENLQSKVEKCRAR